MRGSEETEKNIKQIPRSSASTASCESTDKSRQTFLSKTKQHLLEPVTPSLLAEIELLVLTFCTGIQGKPSTPSWPYEPSN